MSGTLGYVTRCINEIREGDVIRTLRVSNNEVRYGWESDIPYKNIEELPWSLAVVESVDWKVDPESTEPKTVTLNFTDKSQVVTKGTTKPSVLVLVEIRCV